VFEVVVFMEELLAWAAQPLIASAETNISVLNLCKLMGLAPLL
jgi:hypothetical protein